MWRLRKITMDYDGAFECIMQTFSFTHGEYVGIYRLRNS